jgi:flagellar hook-length control protein FliK
MGSTGTQTAQLQLNPEELGGIHVQLSMQGDKASVQFQAQHSETSELIERLMPRLSQAMEQQGMRLEEAKVSHQSAWADAQQQQQSQQFSDRAQRGVVHFSGDAEPASEPEASREDSAPRGAPRGDSAVDDYA